MADQTIPRRPIQSISRAGTEDVAYDVRPKHEDSSYTIPKPQTAKTGLSWRTRFMGRPQSTVNISEVATSTSSDSPPYEPIQDQEEHQPPLTELEMRELRRNFHPPSQLYRLLFKGFIKWIITVILSATMGGIMYYYSTHVKPMTENDKQKYNFLVIGLSLALGINLASSLKAMATDIRWWLLSLKRRKLREVDLILHLDSLTEVFKLAFVAPRLAPACFSWLLLNIVAQVGIALIGLCFSPDSVTNSALVTKGLVYVPDMSEIYTEAHTIIANKSDSVQDQQYTANNFGTIALDYYWNRTDGIPLPGTLWQANSPIIFQGDSWWQYVFIDRNPEAWNDPSNTNPAAIYTNRSVSVTYNCSSWPVTEGGNGTSPNITILQDAEDHFQHIRLPYAGGPDQTTFITNPNSSDCGSGCSTVHAFEASLDIPWWYECNMTIGDTENALLPEHHVGSALSKMGAAAIALQGHVVDPVQKKTGEQFQSYPATSAYGFPKEGGVDSMGMSIALFSIGVVATAAQWNPNMTVEGDLPDTGSALDVRWFFISIIFGLTCGLQLVLFILCSVVANMVIVKDDSHIATARLLRPIVERLGPMGTYADGKEICRLLSKEGQEKVVYSVKHPQRGILHHLDLGHQKRLRAFPRGEYD